MAGNRGKVTNISTNNKRTNKNIPVDGFSIGKHVKAKASHVYESVSFILQHNLMTSWGAEDLYGTIEEITPASAKVRWIIDGDEYEQERFMKKIHLTLVDSIPVRI